MVTLQAVSAGTQPVCCGLCAVQPGPVSQMSHTQLHILMRTLLGLVSVTYYLQHYLFATCMGASCCNQQLPRYCRSEEVSGPCPLSASLHHGVGSWFLCVSQRNCWDSADILIDMCHCCCCVCRSYLGAAHTGSSAASWAPAAHHQHTPHDSRAHGSPGVWSCGCLRTASDRNLAPATCPPTPRQLHAQACTGQEHTLHSQQTGHCSSTRWWCQHPQGLQ